MTEFNDKHQESDPELRAAYRELATERAPTGLDRSVLKTARQDAGAGLGGNWLTTRIRPLAFVVTAGLTLALLVQLSNTPYFDIPPAAPTAGDDPGRLRESAFQDAARETAEQIRRLEAEAGRSMSPDDAAMSPAATVEAPESPSLLPADDRCTDTDRADSSTWWQCIRDLEKRGLSEAAERELQALLENYPRFSAPQ